MKFGFSLIMRGSEATPEAFTAMAERSEALRLDALWCSAHIIIPPQTKSDFVMVPGLKHPEHWKERYWEPFTVLSYLAAKTTHVRLGTSVTVLPMHNPFEIAKQVAQIDQLSNGRFIFGVGVGWFAEEFETLGQNYHNRGARTDEALRLMKALWTQEPVTFEGRHYAVRDAYFAPKPVSRPHPPIWIGGDSDAALRRTARYADGWHPIKLSPAALEAKSIELEKLLTRHGRKLSDMYIAFKARIGFQSAPAQAGQSPLQGRPSDIVDMLRRYRDAGVDEVVLDTAPESLQPTLDTMQQFVEEVRPKLDD